MHYTFLAAERKKQTFLYHFILPECPLITIHSAFFMKAEYRMIAFTLSVQISPHFVSRLFRSDLFYGISELDYAEKQQEKQGLQGVH